MDVAFVEVRRLAEALRAAPDEAHRNSRKAVSFTAFGIKKAAAQFASGIAHAPHYPRAITYDVTDLGVGVGTAGEIGPDKNRRQGALGNFLEYGDPRTPPQPHLGPALDRWSPDFVAGQEKAAADALEAL
ncbi:hypothetical protein CO540_13310 [Micromonospora sp. WMMA2032]|nr:hypothetical protein CO540_13310 [Micromonospora sp. WMMA2032]